MEAICNILDNAVKYTNEGSISLSVTAYEMFVRIDIKDSGIGIKEEEFSKIFQDFIAQKIPKYGRRGNRTVSKPADYKRRGRLHKGVFCIRTGQYFFCFSAKIGLNLSKL